MKEAFIEKDFRKGSLEIIEKANEIIAAYQAQGFTLTLRQLYYQFVSRDLIANKQSEYKRLGSVINDARIAGLIDWSAIEDRTRNVRRQPSWTDPAAGIRSIAEQYRENIWLGQPRRVEVWIEKDALIGVVEPVCQEFRLPYFACRGYSSQSEQYAAGTRFRMLIGRGIEPLILHLGDHDPSGMDMTRDNEARVSMFALGDVEVRRLALNWDQIEQYNPPPNPAKETDSRSGPYIAQFGESSWELDALEPTVIDALIRHEVESVLDVELWDAAKDKEDIARTHLGEVSRRWDEIEGFLEGEAE